MPIIIKLQDIDEAIENLRYKSETTLKFRLLRAIRQYYTDDESADTLSSIDTEELVRTVWETGDDRDLIKTKRKNFSSLKSSVNSDLKKIYAEGKNPQGIVIGHNNVFSISDEAKDKALAGIMDVFREKGIDTQSKISEILSALNDILSTSISETDAENTREEIDRLKTILSGISGKLGFSLTDIIRRAQAAGKEEPPAGESDTGLQPESGPREEGPLVRGADSAAQDIPGRGENLSGYIRGGLSLIDQGLQGLAREIEEASASSTQKDLVESVHAAIDDIVAILKDSRSDASGKAQKILVSVNQMLTDTLEASGIELPAHQAQALKQIFAEMTRNATEPGSDQTATGAGLQAAIRSILGEKSLSVPDRISRMMAAVDNVVGETLDAGSTGLDDGEVAKLKEAMGAITGKVDALVAEIPSGPEKPENGADEPLRAAMSEMVRLVRSARTDAAEMMDTVGSLFEAALDHAGDSLSPEQAGELKRLLQEMAEDKDGSLFATISGILGPQEPGAIDHPSGWQDKVSRILAAARDAISEAVEQSSAVSTETDQSRIRDFLSGITDNLQTLGLETLAGLELVEEIVEEGAAEGFEEVIEEIAEEETLTTDVSATREIAQEADAGIEMVEEVLEAVSDHFETTEALQGAGAAGEMEVATEEAGAQAGQEDAQEAATGGKASENQGAMQAALTGLVEALQDTETDREGKSQKIMQAMQGLLDEALTGSGLSETQTESLRQILQGLGNDPEGPLGVAVSDILDDGGMNSGAKLGKMLTALGDAVNEAMEEAGGDLSQEDRDRIRRVLASISEDIEAHGIEALAALDIVEEVVEEETGTDPAQKIIEEPKGERSSGFEAGAPVSPQKVFAEIAAILQDAEMDAAGKAASILDAVEGMLDGTVSGGDKFRNAVSVILEEEEQSNRDKLYQIISAVGDMLDESIDDAGASVKDEDRERIRELLQSITRDPETLAGLEVIEEGAGAAGEMEVATEEASAEAGREDAQEAATGGSKASENQGAMQAALTGLVEALQDTETDREGKSQKIMQAVQGLLDEAITGSGLSETQEESLRQILQGLAADPEGPLGVAVSDILDDGAMSSGAKLGKMLTALGDAVNEAMEEAGADLSQEDRDRIRRVLASISEDIEAHGIEALAALDIVEEVVEDGTYADGATASEEISAAVEAGPSEEVKPDTDASVRKAFAEIAAILQDAETDDETKAAKILSAVEDLMGGPLDEANRFFGTLLAILEEKDQSDREKLCKIMAAAGEVMGIALEGAGALVSDEEQAHIRDLIQSIAGNLGELASLEVIEEVIEEGAAGEMEVATEEAGAQAGREDAREAATGGKASENQVALQAALTGLVEALQDTETDREGKSQKIMQAVQGLLDEAITGSGLSETQEESLRQILQGLAADPEGPLGHAVSDILADDGMNSGAKLGKMLTALGDAVNEAMEDAGGDLSQEDRDRIRRVLASIAGDIETHGIEALAALDIVEEVIEEGTETGGAEEIVEAVGAGTSADVKPDTDASVRKALADIAGILQDPQTDAAGKAAKILAVVEGMLGDTVTASGEFADDDRGDVRQILLSLSDDLKEGKTVSGPTGSRMTAAVSDILADASINAADKIGKIMGLVNDLIAEALAQGAELSDEEQARIRQMMSNITANLEAFGQEALEGLDIVEEVIDAGESAGPAASGQDSSDFTKTDAPIAAVDTPAGEASDAEGGAGPAEGSAGAALSPSDDVLPDTAAEEVADYVEEIIEEAVPEPSDIQVTPADQDIDEELREKTDLLTRLAEAAGILTGLGPDLGGSVYTEEEIRGKAKFLSEEFDRYLSIRDKFYNAHILIKAGRYRVGGAHLAKSVLPEQIVSLPDYYIGKFPVTNALFEIFVEQTGYVTTAEKYGYGLVYYPRMQRSRDPISGVERFSLHNQAYSKKVPGACWHRPQGPDSSLHLKRTHPVVQVSLEDARAFAVWTGKRLPTEIEWEAAARTAQGLTYPWGDEWRDNACNTEKSLHGDTTAVDLYVKFANALEVADMLGNVLEWTADVVGDPETSDTAIAKGASWISHDEISLTDRHYMEKSASSNILGFRCVAI